LTWFVPNERGDIGGELEECHQDLLNTIDRPPNKKTSKSIQINECDDNLSFSAMPSWPIWVMERSKIQRPALERAQPNTSTYMKVR